jgi:DNA/RNA endonuclease YhcR with UshA esterase domain
MLKKTLTGWLAVFVALVALVPAGSVLAHHSLANYDTTKAVRVKGTILRVHEINPHSFIYLEQQDADGTVRRWAVEGPSIMQLKRLGFDTAVLKPGTVVEACGYLPKEPVMWQIASADSSAASLAGRLLNGELIVMPDGRELSWGDYGVHKCFAPGHSDQHSR